MDCHVYLMKQRADALGARMVVIDSISAFEAAVPDPGQYHSYMWAINDYFRRDGVTVVMTTEVGVFGPLEISAQQVSFVADNIIFLRFAEIDGEIKPAVGVLKMRGSANDRHLRELIVDPPRIALGQPLSQLGLVAASVPEALGAEMAIHAGREAIR